MTTIRASAALPELSPAPKHLRVQPATIAELDRLVELDRLCFGKLWSRDTYQRELDSPNSEILLLRAAPDLTPHATSDPALEPDPNPDSTSIAQTETPIETPIETSPPILGYGCVWAILDEAHVTILGVRPEARRRGYGEVLLYGLLAIASHRQLTRATLEVSTQNRAALALYEKVGFQRAGCRKGYYPNGDDAAILWKSGLQHPQFPGELAAWRQILQGRIATP